MTYLAHMKPPGDPDAKEEDIPILGAYIQSLNQLGQVTLKFNVTLIPELIYKPDLEKLLRFEIVPQDDGSDISRVDKLTFDWSVTGFDKDESTISFQLDFKNAPWISSG